MIVNSDSPLLVLPEALNSKQAQFTDGLRLSVQMFDLAYHGLLEQLRAFTPREAVHTAERMVFSAPAFLHAWSAIDSAHRLRGLIENLPGLEKKHRIPEVRTFLDRAEAVEKLRHAVQHMEGQIRQNAQPGYAVWGYLRWKAARDGGKFLACFLTAGSMMRSSAFQLQPAASEPKEEIDVIELLLGDTRVYLGELYDAIMKLIRWIEARLREQFTGQPAGPGGDYFVAFPMKQNPDGSVTLLAPTHAES
jgi:hypothetical protein